MKWIGLSAVVLATVAKASAQVTPVNVPSYKNWTFTGCFGDNPVNRSLHHIVGGASDTIVEICLDTCDGLGFGFAGLEFSSECYCGNALLYGYGTSDACTMTCSGNSTELCGGPNALSVYGNGKVPLTQGPAVVGIPDPNNFATQNWGATSCLSDDQWQLPGGVRLFEHMPGGPIPAEEMTANKCILGCATSSYTLAGLENGQECWCDKKHFPFANEVPMSDCSSPCLGNATEICGGPSRLFAYLFNNQF